MKQYETSLVERYETLQKIIKESTKELDILKADFIASHGGETDQHLIVIKEMTRESVASKAVFTEKLGATFLQDNGLLNQISYSTVVIAPKQSTRKVG